MVWGITHVAQAPLNSHGVPCEVDTINLYTARIWREHAHYHIEQCRLTCTIWAEETKYLTRGYLKRKVSHGKGPTSIVGLAHMLKPYHVDSL